MRTELRKLLLILSILVLTLALAACGGEPAPAPAPAPAESGEPAPEVDDTVYKLTWAGIGSTEAIDTWIGEEAARRISEQTDGHVEITVYPASQLGDMTQAYDEIIAGTIDLGLFTIYGTYNMICESLYIPFLTTDYTQFRDMYAEGGYIYEAFEQVQNDTGVTLFGLWPAGYLGITFTDIDDESTLFDFTTSKTDLVRVPAMDSMLMSLEAMGFQPTTINYSDVYTSLQTGVCDGSWNGGAYANYESFRDVIKYFVDYRVCNDVYACVMNTETFAGLPAEYQDVMTSVLKDVINEGIDMIEEQDSAALADMEAYGITVISPTDEQREEMRLFFIDNVWPDMAQFYGEDFMAELAAAAKGM